MTQPAPSRRRAYLREWLALAFILLILVGLASRHASLERLDHLAQDLGSRLFTPPASPEIVIVAIDDASLAAIGRWPWRRALHAELLERITRQHPRAIGMDILLGEADGDYPADDAVLAQAIARAGRVVLPVARRGPAAIETADLPLPPFARAAAQIGHVQMQVDNDGIARAFHEQEGPAAAPWPDFGTALRCAAGLAHASCRGHASAAQGPWERTDRRQITFARGDPPFATYAYLDVLIGKVAPDAFTGKYVLIGATATGLGDLYATPAAVGAQRLPGVLLLAHALNTELQGLHITPAPADLNTALNLALVATALLGLWLLGPLGGLVSCALLALLALALALAAPLAWGTVLAPAAALAGIFTAYPLWSWRRLSFATHFLRRELLALHADGITPATPTAPYWQIGRMEQRILDVEAATRQLRNLHHLIADSLEHLPSPTFICDDTGRITLATKTADVFERDGQTLRHQWLPQALSDLTCIDTGQALLPAWPPTPFTPREGRDANGHHWLMLASSFAQRSRRHWLVTLVDLTGLREAQAQRDQALRFISHDLRGPASAILTLLEMQRALPDPLPPTELHARIERHAENVLAMARGFTHLATAQTRELHREALDLVLLLQDATQRAWASAQGRQVSLNIDTAPEQAPCEGDRELLTRAIDNLLANAIKFTAPASTVHCGVRAANGLWRLDVRDAGPGIAPDQQKAVFEPFKRLPGSGEARAEGFGLGLTFVSEVMHRHGGRAEVASDGTHGSTFTLVLPMHAPAAGQRSSA